MVKPSIIITKEDINNSLQHDLWDNWLSMLGLAPIATEVYLQLSPFDTNQKLENKE